MAVVTENAVKTSVTANDMIEKAYRLLGDTNSDGSITAAQASNGLAALNAMLDLWSISSLMVYVQRQEALSWTANTASMTIGDGATLDTHRPDRILDGTYFQDSNSVDYPVRVIRDRKTFDRITDKTVQSSFPSDLFFEPTSTWGTLYAYPVPNQALTLYLNSYMPLQYFDTLTEAHTLPPGYQTLIEYNLAEYLEGEVGLPLPEPSRNIARNSLAAVKRNNNLPIYSQTESAYVLHGRGRSDIEAGTP